MREILLLIFLCRRLGQMLRAKGRTAGWFQALLVVCWFGGELVGGVAMLVLFGASPGGGIDASAYFGALLGAAGGAVIVFVLANTLAPLHAPPEPRFNAFPVMPPGPSQAPPSDAPPV